MAIRLFERLLNSLRHDGAIITLRKLLVRLCRPAAEVAVEILLAKDLSADIPAHVARVPVGIILGGSTSATFRGLPPKWPVPMLAAGT